MMQRSGLIIQRSIVSCILSATVLLQACAPSHAYPGKSFATSTQAQSNFAADPLAATHGPRLSDIAAEPEVRVRVAKDVPAVRIATDATVTFHAQGAPPLRLVSPVEVTRANGVWRLSDGRGQQVEFRGRRLNISPSTTGTTRLNDAVYPGSLFLLATAGSKDGLDAVNTVGMESYLPGVLQRELFPDWEPVAFRAQAVAARSYAIWEVARSRSLGRPYDLESTTIP